MKTVFNNKGVIQAFVEQNQEYGRNSKGSLYFNGDVMYSYGAHFSVARIIGKVALLTTQKYSVTTSGHVSEVHSALRDAGYTVYAVYDVLAESRMAHMQNGADMLEEANEMDKKAKRARSYKQYYIDNATRRRNDELQYRQWYLRHLAEIRFERQQAA